MTSAPSLPSTSPTLHLVKLRSADGILGGGLDATLATSGDEIVQAWADLLFDGYSTSGQHLGCADHILATLSRRQNLVRVTGRTAPTKVHHHYNGR